MTRKILVADDSVTIHKVVRLTFADQNVVIESVTNGSQVVEKACSMKPDIILADVFMPGLNGYEVCESIKTNPELSQTPVVLLVGSFEPFDQAEASRVKCDAHITKPFSTSELVEIVLSLTARGTKPESAKTVPPEKATGGGEMVPTYESALARNLVSAKTRESFLGSNRILDVFGMLLPAATAEIPAAEALAAPPEPAPVGQDWSVAVEDPTPKASEPANECAISTETVAPASPAAFIPQRLELSEETLNDIVERVVRHMSRDIVREVAWEVVPELSEILIRQWLREHHPVEDSAGANRPPDLPALAR